MTSVKKLLWSERRRDHLTNWKSYTNIWLEESSHERCFKKKKKKTILLRDSGNAGINYGTGIYGDRKESECSTNKMMLYTLFCPWFAEPAGHVLMAKLIETDIKVTSH